VEKAKAGFRTVGYDVQKEKVDMINDANLCHKITNDIDIVFSLAALSAIPYSYIAPNSYVDTNVKGALNICQSSCSNGVERVVQVSTSEVYGSAQYVQIDEKHPLEAC